MPEGKNMTSSLLEQYIKKIYKLLTAVLKKVKAQLP